jgi:glycosyltransferase involved in cell wall biosynthesis
MKKILVMAPQPFFQDRGTPIAVKLLVEELAGFGFEVHLLVFHEGRDVQLPGVILHRIPKLPGVKNIPPSISWKKIICDLFMLFKALSLVRQYQFDLIHAVEESVYMARVIKLLLSIPYIYDMDSSLALQVVDKLTFLRPLRPVLDFFEKGAVKGSIGVVAVCKELEDIAANYAPDKNILRLEDISLLDDTARNDELLRQKYQIEGPIMLYVGNLEGYQGIDLLLESFKIALNQGCSGNVVIIGGTEETIAAYRTIARGQGVFENTYFCGPRPVAMLAHYLRQADILLSPRVQGNNTPMKLYSYLDSAKPVLATRLVTHTQVLTDEFSCLVEPDPESMAQGIARLLSDLEAAKALGEKGRIVAQQNYSLPAFRQKLSGFYQKVVRDLDEPVP